MQGKIESKEDVITDTEVSEDEGKETEKYKIGIVTPTMSTSEDEFRAGENMAEKYPDIVKHITLPENFSTELETGISQIVSLSDDPDMKAIVVCSGQSGLLPAFQKIREVRPDIITMSSVMDDPDLMAKYIDINFTTDYEGRGKNIVEKADEMGAKTFIHYSFPTHLANEVKAKMRDVMKETCEELDMTFVEVMTPDPQTGDGKTAMQEFLKEDIPRQIEKHGVDTNIYGTNCPMYDVIIDEALKLKFTVAEQCCPTPTQAYPTVMSLEIHEEDVGDFDKINEMISEKVAEADMTGRFSGWPMPSSVFLPEFAVELSKYIVDNDSDIDKDILNDEFLGEFAKDTFDVEVYFRPLKEDMNNYYMYMMDSIFY